VFTLPAGLITDRADRRRLVATMDAVRLIITTAVAGFVFTYQTRLPTVEAAAAEWHDAGGVRERPRLRFSRGSQRQCRPTSEEPVDTVDPTEQATASSTPASGAARIEAAKAGAGASS